jgi:hypothetical protein
MTSTTRPNPEILSDAFCQLNNQTKKIILCTCQKEGQPISDPRFIGRVIKNYDRNLWQTYHLEFGDDAHWVTFPLGLTPESFGNALRDFGLKEKQFIQATCSAFGLEFSRSIAQKVRPGEKSLIYAEMKTQLRHGIDRVDARANGQDVVVDTTDHHQVLNLDYEMTSAVRIEASDLSIESSWGDQELIENSANILMFLIEARIFGGLVATLGYILVHGSSGSVEIILDYRYRCWEAEQFLWVGNRKKEIDIVQVSHNRTHYVLLKRLDHLFAERRIRLNTVCIRLFGVDLFQFQGAFKAVNDVQDPQERELAAFELTHVYRAFKRLNYNCQLQVICDSKDVPISVYIEARPAQTFISIAAA